MLNPPIIGQDRVTTAHRAKLAYIYVRQSTLGQVHQNPESEPGEHGIAIPPGRSSADAGLALGEGAGDR